jgi:hypothetical protein
MKTNIGGDVLTAQVLIPGAYERRILLPRQSGSMGGAAFGSENLSLGPSTMSVATIADREKEGGGAVSQRRRPRAARRRTPRSRR